MRYNVTFGVRVATQQKAVSLRDRMLAWLENEPDVEVFNWTAGRIDPEWQVVGVDTANDQPFVVTVVAETWEEAEGIVLGQGSTRVIAAYRGSGGTVIIPQITTYDDAVAGHIQLAGHGYGFVE